MQRNWLCWLWQLMLRTRGRARSSDSGLIEMLDIAEILVIYIKHTHTSDSSSYQIQVTIHCFYFLCWHCRFYIFLSSYLGKKGNKVLNNLYQLLIWNLISYLYWLVCMIADTKEPRSSVDHCYSINYIKKTSRLMLIWWDCE